METNIVKEKSAVMAMRRCVSIKKDARLSVFVIEKGKIG